MFWCKTISGNDFTPHCMFGCTWKIKFSKKHFIWPCKIWLWPENWFTFLFSLQTISRSQTRKKRDKERERRDHLTHSLTPILSLTVVRSPSSLTHAELSHSIHSLMVVQSPSSTHSSLSAKRRPTVSFLSPVDLFLSPIAFVYGFDGFTPSIHTLHLTSPLIHTPPTSPHLTSPRLRSTHLRPHLTSPPIHTPPIHIPSNSDMPKSTLKPINNPSSDPPLGSDL